jgi:hypothetical protein
MASGKIFKVLLEVLRLVLYIIYTKLEKIRMADFGIENTLYHCSRTDKNYHLTLYFYQSEDRSKEYLDFNCANKFNCGIYMPSRHTFGEFDWKLCPAHSVYKSIE